jgi:uncharacterized membrane protein YdjX (TVP38/TMEM64 family)
MAVEGPAARALGELVRERWRRATGQKLRAPAASGDVWPESLVPDFEDVDVAVARTLPRHEDREEVREVEALYRDGLRAARRFVYLENQYLTSRVVEDTLAELLEQPGGPEVVIVVPRGCSGWLEETTMGALRARLVERLRRSDREDRLRIYSPLLPEGAEERLTVHSKVMVVDDRLLRVGSANLANRSMGLDSECDLAIERGEDGPSGASITRLRDRLLGEHLGVEPGTVAHATEEHGSLIAAIESLRQPGGARTLEPLEASTDEPVAAASVVTEGTLLDPERPIEMEEFVGRVLPETLATPGGRRSWLRVGGLLLAVALLAGLWRWTPFGDMAAPERLSELAGSLRSGPVGLTLAVLAFATAGALMVPVTVLIVACALAFGWSQGAVVALPGSLLTAAIGYLLGAQLARDAVRRLIGRRGNELSRRLARRGVLAVAALRVVPVAPFALVNLAAGASHIRWRDFALGTLLGMGPGVVMMCLAVDRAAVAVTRPGWQSIAVALLAFALLLGVGVAVRRVLGRAEEA